MAETIDVLVGGSTGPSGKEVVRVLEEHPHVENIITFSRDLPEPGKLKAATAAILALPWQERGHTALYLHGLGKKVVDLAATFRQSAELYEERYGQPSIAPQLLPRAAYGLPELHREQIRENKLVAAPGCYPTAIRLALAPLTEADLLEQNQPIGIKATSGGTGKGRVWEAEAETFKAAGKTEVYATGREHRHVGEIEQFLEGRQIDLTLSVGPYDRGIDAEIKLPLRGGITAQDVHEMLSSAYSGEPLVTVLAFGEKPHHEQVNGTDACHIGVTEEADVITAWSSIDNLRKGAGGQGVQCLNLMCGFPETAGLRIAD
jgi:N-acetyl-gamma-glutamyl-phosphate reductase